MVILTHSKTRKSSLANIAWKTLEKVAAKEQNRDELSDGHSHRVDLEILGTVDGKPVFQKISSVLSVGHAITKSSSVNPQIVELVGYILGKLNQATRERILADIPADFADNDNRLPETDTDRTEEARQFLKALRRCVSVKSRGPVKCEYTVEVADELLVD